MTIYLLMSASFCCGCASVFLFLAWWDWLIRRRLELENEEAVDQALRAYERDGAR